MNDSSEETEDDDDLLNREEIAQSLAELGFEETEQLANLADCCHRVIPVEDVEDAKEGELTRLGGAPDVSSDFQWPTYQGRHLSFLGQFDFYEDGILLSFFYDTTESPWGFSPEHIGSCKVFAFDRTALVPAEFPAELAAENQFPTRDLRLGMDINLPNSKSEILNYLEIPKSDIELLEKLENDGENDPVCHHLLGFPILVQGDMELMCEKVANGIDCGSPSAFEDETLESFIEQAERWRLLFQCDSDPKAGWNWGDEGRLFFWIKREELEAGNFENVLAILQTS